MSLRTLLLVVAASAVFFFTSSTRLPPTVASHFGFGGAANGFMARSAYIPFMAIMTLGLPLLIGLLLGLGRHLPSSLINLPNRSYWLAPEHIEATHQYIARQARIFSALLVVFMSFVHWQVVQANLVQPPKLPERPFIFGLILFMLATVAWVGASLAHFRRART
jgi:uncharacterized membrane protein